MDVEEPLLLFRAQYLQCVDHDFLTWPPPQLLKQPDVQQFLLRRLFDHARLSNRTPPVTYEHQVLRTLIAKIQKSAGASAAQSTSFQELSARLFSLDEEAASDTSKSPLLLKQDAYVTYNCSTSLAVWQPITLHESRSLISGSSFTGHRTWEGALHLASYLLANPSLVSGKRVLELGAGTGFLSILCRKYIGSSHVIATDGDERVMAEMRDNLKLNDLGEDDGVATQRLWWGKQEVAEWQQGDGGHEFETVIGADIIYQKEATSALVEALRAILDLQPQARIILSNAFRFPKVFEVFREGCAMPLELVEIKHHVSTQ